MVQEGNVNICPITKEEWEARAKEKQYAYDCGGQNVYHCLADNEGRKWERCVEKSLIKKGISVGSIILQNCTYLHANDKFILLKR